MFTAADFCRELAARGCDFYAGVPDTVIEFFCNHIQAHPPAGGRVLAANEGGAVGLAAGYWLASGRIPLVYLQNSGIGNAVNPLLSLADPEVFAIPMLLLIGWRGRPGVPDEPQHLKQGRVTQALLDSLEIPWRLLDPDPERTGAILDAAFARLREAPGPYALIAPKGCFAPVPALPAGRAGAGPTREEAIGTIIAAFDSRAAFVASTGMGPRELYEIREALGQGHERDFLNAGAMGHASMIAAGAALARPDRPLVCLDGDGALLMHLGASAVIPSLPLPNFVHVLLNNGVHDSVGGQPNLFARLDAVGLARGFGYRTAARAAGLAELGEILAGLPRGGGPHFVEAALVRGFRKDLGRPKIPFAEAARQFQSFLAKA
ncbi:MAG: phosphonopyruvate decarboxylase [Planctomycetota bacterium]|jgi:phosphonopyruvate decarboxylase|nr:phosphonopyruvate decarboxylase [Planctomycetota bacterium]